MSDINFLIEEELQTILLKEYELNSHIKGCHDYMMKQRSTVAEFLKARLKPENEFDKFAVAVEKCNFVVGHLLKLKTD